MPRAIHRYAWLTKSGTEGTEDSVHDRAVVRALLAERMGISQRDITIREIPLNPVK